MGTDPKAVKSTLAASSFSGTSTLRAEDTAALARARNKAAKYDEARTALMAVRGAALAVLLLLVLAAFADSSLSPADLTDDQVATWTRSLFSLVLLLIALQWVSLLLAVEHAVTPSGGLGFLWVVRAVVVLAVVLAVVVAKWGPTGWPTVFAAGLLAELVTLLVLSVVSSYVVAPPVQEPQATDEPLPDKQEDPDRLWAIGASGGGIRAAAFVLGGHQAIRDDAGRLRVDEPAREPHVFAVSGGSYMAAALALRRTFDAGTGTKRSEPVPFGESYQLDSPELERLRRHTRYLFEPAARTRDGLVSLLMGAIVNLFILGVVLRFVAWTASQFAISLGLVSLKPCDPKQVVDCSGELVSLQFASGWTSTDWLLLMAVPIVLVLGIVLLTLFSWNSTAKFDDTTAGSRHGVTSQEAGPRRRAIGRLQFAARTRPTLLFLALGWVLLLVGLPAATVGVSSLATHNHPTTTGAAALTALGFATEEMCTEAFVEQVDDAVDKTSDEVRISPGETRERHTGACGLETTVSRSEAADDSARAEIGAAARDYAGGFDWPLQTAGIGVLLGLVGTMLRRGPSPEASADTGLLGRLKRTLMTYVPLAIVTGIGIYLSLRWTFGFLATASPTHTVWAAGFTVLACALAYLVDANATSMHGFYRSAISDAFAVGIDPADGRAKELPAANVYRFSDLSVGDTDEPGGYPRLHIVTTLNSQAANEAPSMRGGFPFVFGQDEVNVYREEGRRVHVRTKDYEEFAGPGRVSIMAAVATSGAAISPLMGRYAAQMAPYRMLLALFNVRVGAWVLNPLHVTAPVEIPHDRPGFLWMTRKAGLAQVALEAVGRSSAERRWIYLSDGGHLDNTGLVECVRHCAARGQSGRIVVLDASNDPVDSWSAVGDAIGVIRADLKVDLRREMRSDEPPWMRRFKGGGFDVTVVKAVRVEPKAPDRPGKDWLEELPPNVVSFQMVHKDFPRASTTRQMFGDLEFEAYRAFGYAAAKSAIEVSFTPVPEPPATP